MSEPPDILDKLKLAAQRVAFTISGQACVRLTIHLASGDKIKVLALNAHGGCCPLCGREAQAPVRQAEKG